MNPTMRAYDASFNRRRRWGRIVGVALAVMILFALGWMP